MIDFSKDYDVVIIGAGPSGTLAGKLLRDKGHQVLILEREYFPRFSIGESLLPQSMEFLEAADMLSTVEAHGFQFKNGAAFRRGDKYDAFDFTEKFSPGWGTTFQVQRADFDHILAKKAQSSGVDIRWGHQVTAFEVIQGQAQLTVRDDHGNHYEQKAGFVLDASGFGRVLPKLLNIEKCSTLQNRTSLYTHIEDNINDQQFDRNKILISVHPKHIDVWYWLIPFSNGRSSVGVIAKDDMLATMPGDNHTKLLTLIGEVKALDELLCHATFDTPVGNIVGYSSDVETLYGNQFALLGNAGEFLDPVFSSGVTIALKSAYLAAQTLDRELSGQQPNWELEFSQPLKQGVDTFRVFVQAWYDGKLQNVIFAQEKNTAVKKMVCSILAGYAWDLNNPLVRTPSRLDTLAELCAN